MAIAKTANRKGVTQRHRVHNGEKVTPALYCGLNVGHGKYLAGMVNDRLIEDASGRPLQFRDFPLQ